MRIHSIFLSMLVLQACSSSLSSSAPDSTAAPATAATQTSTTTTSSAGAATAPSAASEVLGNQTLPEEIEALAQTDELGWSFHSPTFFKAQPEEWQLQSRTRIGGTSSSGNQTSTTISGSQDFVLAKGLLRIDVPIAGIYERDKVAGTSESTNRLFYARPQLEYLLTERLYSYLGGSYEKYPEAGLQHLLVGESGLGYYLLETSSSVLKAELGYRYDREIHISPYPAETIHSVDTGVELSSKLSSSLLLDLELMSLVDVEKSDNYRFFGNGTLTLSLTEHVGIGGTIGVRYDNEPLPGYKRSDRYHTFDLTVQF